MSEVVMKEQIDKILTELRIIISDAKFKKLSNKILEEMIKIKYNSKYYKFFIISKLIILILKKLI